MVPRWSFFGRFVAVLRALAALLAGVNHMPWPRFLTFNAAGGFCWAMVYGIGGGALSRPLPPAGRPLPPAPVGVGGGPAPPLLFRLARGPGGPPGAGAARPR